MIEFIVLGLVPGTSIQLSFKEILIFYLACISTIYFVWKLRRLWLAKLINKIKKIEQITL